MAAQHEIDFGHARGVFHEAYPPGIRTLIYLFLKHIKPADAQLGPIRLVGYDLNASEVAAGEDIVLRHYWRAESPTDSIQHVFNHLINEDGEIAAQADYAPLWDDRRPTTIWDDPAEIMLGREFVLSLPPDFPAGPYQLISGFYDPVTRQRLLSADGVDAIDIADITGWQLDI